MAPKPYNRALLILTLPTLSVVITLLALLFGLILLEGSLGYRLLVSAGMALSLIAAISLAVIRPLQQRFAATLNQIERLSLNHPSATSKPDSRGFPAIEALLANRVAQMRRQHQTQQQLTQCMSHIYQQTHDVMLVADARGQIIEANPSALNLLGTTRELCLGNQLCELIIEEENAQQMFDQALQQGRSSRHHLTLNWNDQQHSVDAVMSLIRSEGSDKVLLVARDRQVDEDAANRIAHLAYHDTLTDLPNRTLLTDRVNRALKRMQRSRQIGALLFLDLDKFKRINDTLGHSVGDLLLRELATRLRNSLRAEDTISRLGGDEFVILIEQLGTDQARAEQQIDELAGKVRALLEQAYHLDGHELHVTGSIGYVTFPQDGETMETLLRHADLAMYKAKQAGRNTVTRFNIEMDEQASTRMRVENDVRSALREGHMTLYFQPILRIRDGGMHGAEVLLRWIDDADVISPGQFLPQIEDGALMLKLADWVMRQACQTLAEIDRDNTLYTPDYIAINLSHQQFHQPRFVDQVKQVIQQTGVDPTRILFEITETVIMSSHHEAKEKMLDLKQLGIRFAIDDFGTGYSSLSYLKQLPADTLKIDKGFVLDITSDPDDAAIVKTILGIADHMGLQVIAEGVETQAQLQFLRANACTLYQGYLGRPPLPANAFIEDLRDCLQLQQPGE